MMVVQITEEDILEDQEAEVQCVHMVDHQILEECISTGIEVVVEVSVIPGLSLDHVL